MSPTINLRTTTVVVDIDSTLADTAHRHHLVPIENRNDNQSWHSYSLACSDDRPIVGMVTLVRLLAPQHIIVLLSGRNDVATDSTESWLYECEIPHDLLRLRRDDELGSVSDYKISALRELKANGHNIVLVIDDYPDICADIADQLGLATITPMLPQHYAVSMPGL